MMKKLFKNATVVLPTGSVETSVLIDGAKIVDIDASITSVVDEIVDCTGLHLLPGVIDDQVHFREPGLTHKEDLDHASRACAKGGVTSFLEMPNTIPNTITQSILEEKLATASRSSLVNYGFYIGATEDNVDVLKHATRTPGIKIFIGSSTGNLLVDEQAALEKIFAESTLTICAHCEDESTVRANAAKYADSTDVASHSLVRNHEAALIATKRAIDLADRHNHRFHVLHVSTAQEAELLASASDLITSEVCPHHLFFNVGDYERLGSLVKMNPSIKDQADNVALWDALVAGAIDIVATDHAPHTLDEKQQPYPNCPSGLPAVENSLALMLNQIASGKCTIEEVVKWMCSGPARIWDIKNKGQIKVGFDADLTLVDLKLEQTVLNENQETKCGWTPWHGQSLTGWPVATWVMGHEAFRLVDGVAWFNQSTLGREIEYSH
ncbi:MAG: dihydroorotase [Mariniblastus sp.]|nr:dihydroorotase [Mariniblastus sp.]